MNRILFLVAVLCAASALGQTPGTLKWRLTTDGDNTYSSLTLAGDGTMYIGRHNLAGGGSLWAINSATVPPGNQSATSYAKWKVAFTNSDGTLDTPALGVDGVIYLGTDLTRFCALDPTNGASRWVFNDSQSQPYGIQGSPAIAADGTIYIGVWENFYALTNSPDATNSAPKWTLPYPNGQPNVLPNFGFGGFLNASPAIGADGTIYINSDLGQLFAINPTNGALNWVTILPDLSGYAGLGGSCTPAIGADGTVYFGAANYFFAVNPANGTYRWSYRSLNRDAFQTSPAIGPDGTIYVHVLGDTNRLLAFDPNGSAKWTNRLAVLQNQSVDTLAKQGSCAVASNGVVYVSDTDGRLYAFNSDGTTNWVYATGTGSLNAPLIGPDGTVYVQSYEVGQPYVYAINGSAGPANSSWPMYRQNAQRTSMATVPIIPPSGVTLSAPVRVPNGFQFTVTGLDGLTVGIVASTNLVNWTGVGSVVLTGGTANFVDTAAGNFQRRFYRAGPATSVVTLQLSAPVRTPSGFQFTISGPSGQTVNIIASTNLVNWANIGSAVLTGGTATFTDTAAANFPRRFYRAQTQ